ncbi:HpcH/HpaI aldolase/citrate lyase family protein [Caballeronia grimmiae]|uniref:CoA ester lyase n=1 Tax=Caballeronia grimmiae TaxID=1071679 RepID=A0ABQ1SAD3_9BURK|nr:CoA ester lyase [Caballeronia grimmiae]GGD97920.1 CoA ester lyase [Caballeronia grimmiae]
MIRSFLFVPADSRRKLEKSLTSSADAVIFDLEDAVAPERKADARRCLAEFLAENRNAIEKRVFIRLNDLTTGLTLDDLAATMPFRPDGYVLPKSRGGCDVRMLGLYLDAFEKAYPGDSFATNIIAIATETATSVFSLNTYKDASSRLYGLMWGAEDLSADVGARTAHLNGQWTPVFDLARSMCLFAASHAGVIAIDTIPAEIHNAEALRLESDIARRDGFAAKAAIHPAQVGVINEAFSPSAEERAWATRVMAAFGSGDGVATLDGRMLDRPHLKLATRLLTATSAVDTKAGE